MTNDKLLHCSFGDVKGALTDGTSVSISFTESNRISIEFTYTDRLDGCTYHVSASGYQTKIDKEAVIGNIK